MSPTLPDLVVRRLRLALLQHQETVPLPSPPQPREISRPTEAVYGDDSHRPRSDDGIDGCGIEAVRGRVDIGEHRHRTGQAHGLGDLDVPEQPAR